jgi:hypothetical protein
MQFTFKLEAVATAMILAAPALLALAAAIWALLWTR